MSILVITTGGTIGAMPFDDPTSPLKSVLMPPDNRDFVREFLGTSYPGLHYLNAGHHDSKHIDDAYRMKLVLAIETAIENKILITHGTDALLQTADFIYRQIERSPLLANKTILLTGAMTPLSNGPGSDGYLNLKFSLELLGADQIKAGIYIVLCAYERSETKSGWKPQLYRHIPEKYEKFYDPADGRYHHLRLIEA